MQGPDSEEIAVTESGAIAEQLRNDISPGAPKASQRLGDGGDTNHEALENDRAKEAGTGDQQLHDSGNPKGDLFQRLFESRGNGDHRNWGTSNPSIDYVVESLILGARDRIPIQDSTKLPGDVNNLINVILEKRKPQVDWKRRLRMFGASSARTQIYHTMKRESKRYGTRPGIKIRRFHKILVAIDTSGSIDFRRMQREYLERNVKSSGDCIA